MYIAKPIVKKKANIMELFTLFDEFIFMKRRKIKFPKKAAGI